MKGGRALAARDPGRSRHRGHAVAAERRWGDRRAETGVPDGIGAPNRAVGRQGRAHRHRTAHECHA